MLLKFIVSRSVRKLQLTSSSSFNLSHYHRSLTTSNNNYIEYGNKFLCNWSSCSNRTSTRTLCSSSCSSSIANEKISGVVAPPKSVGGVVDTDVYSAVELALDSVVKIFTVASSPNYSLPWQNKSQRESTGSG